MQLDRGQWIALICIVGIGLLVAVESGGLSLGDVIVGGGTLALAVTAYLQVRHLDEQRTYERAARFAWKDIVLKGSPGKFVLEVRMIANLSHTAAVIRFYSLHDQDRRRFAHVWQTVGQAR